MVTDSTNFIPFHASVNRLSMDRIHNYFLHNWAIIITVCSMHANNCAINLRQIIRCYIHGNYGNCMPTVHPTQNIILPAPCTTVGDCPNYRGALISGSNRRLFCRSIDLFVPPPPPPPSYRRVNRFGCHC